MSNAPLRMSLFQHGFSLANNSIITGSARNISTSSVLYSAEAVYVVGIPDVDPYSAIYVDLASPTVRVLRASDFGPKIRSFSAAGVVGEVFRRINVSDVETCQSYTLLPSQVGFWVDPPSSCRCFGSQFPSQMKHQPMLPSSRCQKRLICCRQLLMTTS